MQSGGRNRNRKKGQHNSPRKQKQHPKPLGPRIMHSIEEIAVADAATVMHIAKTCRVFGVDGTTWVCDTTHERPNSTKVNPCDAYFDPQTGHMCGKRARCFQTNIEVVGTETVKQRLDGIATKIFVRQNLLSESRFATFLMTLNAAATNMLKMLCISRGLTYGRDVVFAFKGGNVIFLVLRKLLDQLPQSMRDEWSEIMQIGDMDFEVFIEDATDEMVKDATVLMLYVLYAFRVYMQQHGWSIIVDQEALLAMQTIVPSITSIVANGRVVHSDDSITVPYTRREGCDLLFVPVRSVLMHQYDKREKAAFLETPSPSDTPLNISMNKSLSFGIVNKKGVSPEADIILLRMKHGLRVVVDQKCGKKASAEVIDITISTNRDRMHRIKRLDKSVNWFTLYDFVIDGRNIQIHAPSIDNFVLDLHMFMFVLSEFPWYDPKQAKRMKRYVWFCTMLRLQQGASPKVIVAELASVTRALAAMLPTSKISSPKQTSLARLTPPWSDLIQQIDATHTKALDAGIGHTDWGIFVKQMRTTVMSVMNSFTTFITASSSGSQKKGSTVRTNVRASPVSSLARATLAFAAISSSSELSHAMARPL